MTFFVFSEYEDKTYQSELLIKCLISFSIPLLRDNRFLSSVPRAMHMSSQKAENRHHLFSQYLGREKWNWFLSLIITSAGFWLQWDELDKLEVSIAHPLNILSDFIIKRNLIFLLCTLEVEVPYKLWYISSKWIVSSLN